MPARKKKTEVKLTDEQWQIIHAPIDKHMSVKACAGSGKTTTMIYRIKNMIEHHAISLANIKVLMYNVAAKDDFIKKAKRILGRLAYVDDLRQSIKTIDAYSLQLLKVNNVYNAERDHVSHYSNKVASLIANNEANQSSPAIAIDANIKYLFVDEYQDLDIAHYIIAAYHVAQGKILFICGDPNQNIYAGMKETKRAIDDLIDNPYGLYDEYQLSTSFRCAKNIFRIAAPYQQYPQSISTTNNNSGLINIVNFTANDIVDKIEQIIDEQQTNGNPVDFSQFAIMASASKYITSIENEISNRNFKYILRLSEKNSGSAKARSGNAKPEAITIGTIHQMKGLEFKYVFIVGFLDSILPGYYSNMIDDMRLLYVAITRAIDRLYISVYPEFIKIHNPRSRQISRFIRQITGDPELALLIVYDSTINIAEEYIEHRSNIINNFTVTDILDTIPRLEYNKWNELIERLSKTVVNVDADEDGISITPPYQSPDLSKVFSYGLSTDACIGMTAEVGVTLLLDKDAYKQVVRSIYHIYVVSDADRKDYTRAHKMRNVGKIKEIFRKYNIPINNYDLYDKTIIAKDEQHTIHRHRKSIIKAYNRIYTSNVDLMHLTEEELVPYMRYIKKISAWVASKAHQLYAYLNIKIHYEALDGLAGYILRSAQYIRDNYNMPIQWQVGWNTKAGNTDIKVSNQPRPMYTKAIVGICDLVNRSSIIELKLVRSLDNKHVIQLLLYYILRTRYRNGELRATPSTAIKTVALHNIKTGEFIEYTISSELSDEIFALYKGGANDIINPD